MPPRLVLALALSLALHGVLLVPDLLKRLAVAPPRPALQASLRLPPKPETVAADPLLKNTLDDEERGSEQPPSQRSATQTPRPAAKTVAQQKVQAVQRKLSRYVFYPEYARLNNIEGTVYLYLEISADGTVEDVRIAQSSGFPILDNAAAKGAWAVQKLPNLKSDVYPYVFRLVN